MNRFEKIYRGELHVWNDNKLKIQHAVVVPYMCLFVFAEIKFVIYLN